MIAQELAAHAAERLLHGRDLHEDVRAVALLLDHLLQPAHLSFDATEALLISFLDLRIDRHRFPRTAAAGRCYVFAHDAPRNRRNRKLFETTLTELSAIAALASTGLSNKPKRG